jgi:hypothetical protein
MCILIKNVIYLQQLYNFFAQKVQSHCIYIAKFASKLYKKFDKSTIKTEKNMDELELNKKKRRKEHHYGDIKKACERAKVSPAVFQSAMKKTQLADLTDKETAVVSAFLEIQKERTDERETLKQFMEVNLCNSAAI